MPKMDELGLPRCDLGDAYSNQILSQKQFHEIILRHTKKNYTVLDAGAGEGRLKELFTNYNINYLGVDSAVGNLNWDYSSVVKGDLENLSFIADGAIDLIIMIQVLEHVRNPFIVLKELNRILKPGHKIFISAPQGQGVHQVPHDYFRFTPYGFNHLLNDTGFKLQSINPQLCGDLESNVSRTIWTLEYYIEESKGVPRLILYCLFLMMKVINRFTRYFDKNCKRHTDPIGYFVVAKKTEREKN